MLGHWQTMQTPQNAASDQGLHCLLKLQEVFSLQLVLMPYGGYYVLSFREH